MVATVFLIVFLCFVQAHSDKRLFYGGSISCAQEKIGGKAIAHVEIVTGWKLGEGPCGRNCSQNDVGKLTNAERIQADHVTGTSGFFGNFSTYYMVNSKSVLRDINSAVRSNFSEHVISVNEKEQWEKESLKFSLGLEASTQTINYDFGRWNLRCRMPNGIRSDLKRMNSSPKIVMEPYYRVKLNSKSTISLPMIDPDGDLIRCVFSAFVERGDIPIPAGVTVQPFKTTTNLCEITIDANASLGYRNDSWIAIPLTARDYPTTDILFGTDSMPAGRYSLSSTTAKFHVQMLENILTPIIVWPTAPEGHIFVVYVGATWKTDIYAQASENATIDRFVSFGLDRENVTISYTKDDTSRKHVRYATILWDPSFGDIGQHTFCTRTVDNNGIDSFDQRCFIVHVRENDFNHSFITSMGKPGFFNMPSSAQSVSCEIGASCLLPVFVKSAINLVSVYATENFTEEANIDGLEMVSHDVYRATLSFTKPTPWVEQICLKAVDRNNKTGEEVCVKVVTEYPDPCLSEPCLSGRCRSDRKTGTFVCECLSDSVYGTVCEHKKELCREEKCVLGHTVQCFDMQTFFYCYCKAGFSGKYCETNIDDCRKGSCDNTTAVCRDLVNGIACDCYQRYTGTDCSIEYRFANAEVKLIGSSEVPMIGSSFELECSFIGPEVITGFEMLLNNVSVMSALFNCRVLLEPNSSLYDYSCPSESQLNLIINDVTKDNDGDTWSCTVFLSEYFESAAYTIFVYDNSEVTTEVMTPTNATLAKFDNRESTTEAMTLTNASLAETDNWELTTEAVTSTNATPATADTTPRDQGVRRTANVNIGNNSNDSAEHSCTNTSATDAPRKGAETTV